MEVRTTFEGATGSSDTRGRLDDRLACTFCCAFEDGAAHRNLQ